MPPLPSAPRVLKIEFKYHDLNDANIINRWFWQYAPGGAPSSVDLVSFCNGIYAAYASSSLPAFKSATEVLDTVTAIDLSSPTAAVGEAGVSVPGTDATEPLPAMTAWVISFLIARRYRGGHPRLYLSAPCVGSQLDNDHPVPSKVAQLQTAWHSFITACTGVPVYGDVFGSHVNVSYYEGFTSFQEPSGRYRSIPTPRPSPVIDPIQGYRVSELWGVQRRRIFRG